MSSSKRLLINISRLLPNEEFIFRKFYSIAANNSQFWTAEQLALHFNISEKKVFEILSKAESKLNSNF